MKRIGKEILLLTAVMIILLSGTAIDAPAGKRLPRVENAAERERRLESFARGLRDLPADSLFSLGNDYLFATPARRDSALMCFLTAIYREGDSRGDKDKMLAVAKSYVNAAHVYSFKYSDYAESYRLLREAERICLDYKFDKVLSHVYMNLATDISSSISMQGAAKPGTGDQGGWKYLRRAYDYAERSGNYTVMGYAVFNMVTSYDLSRDTSVLKQYLKRYLSARIPAGTENAAYMKRFCRATLSLLEGDTVKSLSQFRELGNSDTPSRPIEERMREMGRFMEAYVLEVSGKADESLRIVEGIYRDAQQRADTEWMMWSAGNLYLMNGRMGRREEADRWLLEYYSAQEQIAQANSSKTIAELDMQREISRYRERIELLRVKERQSRIVAGAAIVIGLLVTAILVMAIVSARRRNKYIMSLYEKNLQLAQETSVPVPPEEAAAETADDISRFGPDPQAMERKRKDRELTERIRGVLSGPEVFDPEFRLSRLCEEVGSNQTYVTRAISASYGKTFKAVVTDLRVAEACRRFDDPASGGLYTIEAICIEVGFKSRAAFSVAFKSVTGLTPTEYRRAARRYMQ